MTAPQDHDAELLRNGGPAAAIIRYKDFILDQFRTRVRAALAAARRESGPMIIDTLPAFLTRIALALTRQSGLDFASEYSNIAMQHGNERAKLTDYALGDVIREYQILRAVIVETLRPENTLTDDDWDIVHRSIDEAVAEAASAFVEVQQSHRELFTAALSHDFRGPLSNASNYLELLRRDADPGQRAHFAARALSNLKQISRMIGEVLDVTRANAGDGLAVQLEACEATKLAREVVDDMALAHGDRFTLDFEHEVHGHWDCQRIKQALHNLLENAVKYGREDRPIAVHIEESQGRILISVHNEGEPIPPELLPVLFQPYRRAPSAESSRKQGWGLGLVLVEAIAEAHGGSVGVESSAELGTTFIIDVLCDAREWRRRRIKEA